MNTSGTTSMVFALLGWITFAPIFPIIFAISLRGTGVRAKTASSFLATAVGGGTSSALIQRAVEVSIGNPTAYVVTLAFASAGAIFPLYLNIVPAARRQVDPIKDEYVH
jgi:fucose permease